MKIATMIIGAAGLTFAAGIGTVAQVHRGGHAMHEMHGHGPDGGGALAVPQMVEWLAGSALDSVGATDAQRAKVMAVKDRVMAEAKTLHAAHDATHEEFKQQWERDRMDSARLHALVDARMEDLRRVLHTAVDGVVEVHDTLTPEQRRTVIAKLQSMHGAD